MNHHDVLKMLFPLDLGGVFDADITIEGKYLDNLTASADTLLAEMFPDTANVTIDDWERVYAIVPPDGATLAQREAAALQKVRANLGYLTPAYFVSLAAAVGYTITIEELPPNSPGYGPESIWIWRVHAPISQKGIYFTAGDSSAGDLLTDWTGEDILENIINNLKPAHTQVLFVYE